MLSIAGGEIVGVAEADLDRTTADGKASSVQFVHFTLSDPQAKAFKQPEAQVMLGIKHANYGHMAILSGLERGPRLIFHVAPGGLAAALLAVGFFDVDAPDMRSADPAREAGDANLAPFVAAIPKIG